MKKLKVRYRIIREYGDEIVLAPIHDEFTIKRPDGVNRNVALVADINTSSLKIEFSWEEPTSFKMK